MTIADLARRFFGFAAVGAVGTAAHYAVLLTLVEMLGAAPVPASVAGFVVGALVNYGLNRRLVFRSRRAHGEALPRFFTVAGLGLVWNTLLMKALTESTGLHYLWAQVLTTGVLLVWHFAANALWTFRHPPSASSGSGKE